ncbi:MAG: acyl-CoA dehydrogenase, partial [Flavobacteriales bacterium]|nr:acyl-CoA dehydrogenase [Flavobacteriales bacterium]
TYRSCFAMTEPENAGSNPLLLKTHAEKVDGGYVLNGRKWFCTAADGADFLIVLAITDTSFSDPRKSASLFIVPSNAKGFKHVRKISIMGDEGSGWGSHSELEFNDCFVPEDMVLGKIGAGFQIAQERLAPGRIHHCMRWIGICERIFDQLCNRAASRIIGPNKTLASKQHVQNIISENYANISAARLMVLDVAKKLDNGELQHIKRDISSIKFFCSKTLRRLMDDAIQIHGALGMTDDTLLSFYYRHERGASIYDGPDEVHKQVSARSILKTYSQYQTA